MIDEQGDGAVEVEHTPNEDNMQREGSKRT